MYTIYTIINALLKPHVEMLKPKSKHGGWQGVYIHELKKGIDVLKRCMEIRFSSSLHKWAACLDLSKVFERKHETSDIPNSERQKKTTSEEKHTLIWMFEEHPKACLMVIY